MARNMLSEEFSLSKRHLGVIFIAFGAVIVVGAGLALLRTGVTGMLGIGFIAGMLIGLVGLTLLPLGDAPA